MMINFNPVGHPLRRITALAVDGDTINITWRAGGEVTAQSLDLSGIPDNAQIPAEAVTDGGEPVWWLGGVIARSGGVLSITVTLPHGEGASHAARFPDPVTVNGPVALPDCDGPLLTGPVMTSRELPDPNDPTLP